MLAQSIWSFAAVAMTQSVTARTGGGPAALLQQGAFTHDRSRAELADLSAVDPDAEHPVEQQVDVAAGLALLGEQRALGQLADGGFGAASHDRGR